MEDNLERLRVRDEHLAQWAAGEIECLRDEKATLQDWLISRDMLIDSLRQQVKGLAEATIVLSERGNYWRSAAEARTDELAALKHQGEPVFIVFDGSPGPDSPRFIEVETADGRSTFIDGWHEYPKDIAMHLGMWRLGPLYTSAPSIPAGWQLVPVEPTDEMVEAAEVAFEGGSEGIWDAMLAAAPKGEKE